MTAPTAPTAPGLTLHQEFSVVHGADQERFSVALATATSLPRLEATAATWLDPREEARLGRAVPKRRREFLLGRYAAKSALAAWHGHAHLAAHTLLPGAFDQPVIAQPSRAEVTLAHTGDFAVAVAHDRGHPFGVDLETLDTTRAAVVRAHVAGTELPPAVDLLTEEADRLFVVWSVKEALSKALRCGLTCPFELLAVTDARTGPNGICTGTFQNFGQYQFAAWLVAGCTFALVCSRNAELGPVLPSLREFTASVLLAPPETR